MVDSYGKKLSSKSRDIYINNMKGKLGELAVEKYLDELITPIDLEKKPGGDGGIDFKLLSNPETCIQVKARHGKINNTYWSISRNEIEKNTVLVCVFIQEDIDQRQHEYNLILAGFMPTNLIIDMICQQAIKVQDDKALLGFSNLLYSGGLRSYLELFKFEGLSNQQQYSNTPASTNTSVEQELPEISAALSIGSWKYTIPIEDLEAIETQIQAVKQQYAEIQWQNILKYVQPYSTQIMLRQQFNLIGYSDKEIILAARSQKFLNMAKERIKRIEEACKEVFNQEIQVKFEILELKPEDNQS